MTDIPIIFSAPMVRALLSGRKTMTRRLAWRDNGKAGDNFVAEAAPSPWRKARAGDRLWVRESLTHVKHDPVTARPCDIHCYTAAIPPGYDSANPYEPNYLFPQDGTPHLKPKNTPAIHMPRWCSRITLIVTATKIERLQEITKDDVISEGITKREGFPIADAHAGWHEPFAKLWNNLHGAGSWEANPEVVALSFRVIKSNIDAAEARAA